MGADVNRNHIYHHVITFQTLSISINRFSQLRGQIQEFRRRLILEPSRCYTMNALLPFWQDHIEKPYYLRGVAWKGKIQG